MKCKCYAENNNTLKKEPKWGAGKAATQDDGMSLLLQSPCLRGTEPQHSLCFRQ